MDNPTSAFRKGMRESLEKTAQESSPAMQQLSQADNPFVEPSGGGAEGMLGYLAMPFVGPVGKAAISTAVEPYMAQQSIEVQEPGYNIEMMP